MVLWDYWERHLDPDLFVDHSLGGKVKGKVVIITGGSSGIGKAAALKIACADARLVICARGTDELDATRKEIEAAGGTCHTYQVDLRAESAAPTSEQIAVAALLRGVHW